MPSRFSQLLKHCVRKYFSFSDLNSIIRNSNYGYVEASDKPSEIFKAQLGNRSIKGTASQKWLLDVSLPLMLGKKVSEKDKLWNCFLILLRICRIVFSDTETNFEVIMLGSHVSDFFKQYKKHFFKLNYI